MSSYYEKFLATGEIKCIDEEIPFEIPATWEWARFSTIVNMSPTVLAEDDVNAAFMPMALINAGYSSGYSYETKNWSLIKTGFTKLAVGDIAFAKITPCFQNRKSFILEDVPGKVAAATTELNVLRLYGQTLYAWYVLYFLKSDYFIKEAKYKGTAGQQRVLSSYIQNKLFPIPPYNEQYRIVEKIREVLPVVDKYDKSQKELDKLNALIVDKLKKSILQEAIQGRLVLHIAEEGTAQELLEQIKLEKQKLVKEGKLKKSALNESVIFRGDDNKYYEQVGKKCLDITEQIPFETPKNWVWTRLSHIANIYTGNSISETEKKSKFTDVIGRYYIGTKDVDFNNRIIYDNGIAIPKQYEPDFRLAPNNSILMCIEGGSAGRKIAILNQDVCFGNKLCCFSPFVGIGKYMYYYLQSPSFFELFNLNKTGIIGGVSIAKVKEILIPLPPIKEQQRIVAQIEKLFEQLR